MTQDLKRMLKYKKTIEFFEKNNHILIEKMEPLLDSDQVGKLKQEVIRKMMKQF